MATGRKDMQKAGVAMLILIAAVAQSLFVATFIGPDWPLLMLLSHIAPVFPVIALVALVTLWFTGGRPQWRYILTLDAAACAAMLGLLIHIYAPARRIAAGNAQTLRVVSFNAWTQNSAPIDAARWILAQRPDVVILLEAGERSAAIPALLAPALPYHVSCRGEHRCSTMIFSRWKPIEKSGFARGDADNRRALSAAIMRFAEPAPRFSVVAVHLSRPWPIGAQQRELTQLASHLNGHSREGLLIAGDFNAPMWSKTMRMAQHQLGVDTLGGYAPTWPAPPSGMPVHALFDLDHALIGNGWAAARAERGPALGSDHYPLLLTLEPLAGAYAH